MNEQQMLNEREAAQAFSKQSVIFDAYDAGNTIIQFKRRRVREHVTRWLTAPGYMLELNAGTGIDACWFAGQGFRVHATDVAPGMQEVLARKVLSMGLSGRVSFELCSFTGLDALQDRGPFDCVFSNFAGLNCTDELERVLAGLGVLVRPGGQVTMVLLPGFCLWESLLVFKGRFRTALRRWLAGRRGAASQVEGHHFRCWYYRPRDVIRWMGPEFELLGWEGLCSLVPPSYMEGFAERYPRLFNRLRRAEERWAGCSPWRSVGDYYMISFRKKI